MLELTIAKWLLAFLPLLVLLVTMLVLKWSAPRAGTAAWIVALLCGWLFFGADWFVLGIASAKGLSLSLFVLLIIWTAVFMYNIIDRLGSIGVIGRTITGLSGSRLGQALLLGWVFAGFIQGIAGFGVPVAVIAPLMLMLGFSPVTAAASVLVGHAWAVSFGSMGSSYYAIQLVTKFPGDVIGPAMALLFALPIIASGFAVAHIEGGWKSIRKGALAILIVGVIVSFFVWLMASIGAAQIASVVPGLVGCGAIWLLSKTPLLRSEPQAASAAPAKANEMSFHMAFLPYYLLIFLTVLSQLPMIKNATSQLNLAINYPALKTALGYAVAPEKAYAKVNLVNHPAPLILVAIFITFVVFLMANRWKKGIGVASAKKTYQQCLRTTLGIVTMVMMSLIMTNTGMTDVLAKGIANITGPLFPVFSPYIGVLGCFMTGSNTNSNIMFGALQMETAVSRGISPLVIASVQSIGGSLGSSIAPAKVLTGSMTVGLKGREHEVMRKAMPYCLAIVLLVGLEALVITLFFH